MATELEPTVEALEEAPANGEDGGVKGAIEGGFKLQGRTKRLSLENEEAAAKDEGEKEEEEQDEEDEKRAPEEHAAEGAAADHADSKEEQQHADGDGSSASATVPSGKTRVIANPLGATKPVTPTNPNAEVVRACDPADEVRSSPVKVTELARELKEQFEGGGSNGTAGSKELDTASRTGSGVALTQHDLVNTANVALVLQAGEFKLKPGEDTVPYDELKTMRLEDGLDVSRKEEYLSAEEFEKIFGMDKEEFRNMPNWKRISLKKAKGLF